MKYLQSQVNYLYFYPKLLHNLISSHDHMEEHIRANKSLSYCISTIISIKNILIA